MAHPTGQTESHPPSSGESPSGQRASPLDPSSHAAEFWCTLGDGVEVCEPAWTRRAQSVLPRSALELLAALHRDLEPQRRRLLQARETRQASFDAGNLPGYVDPDEHPEARGDWAVPPLPDDLMRRRVEITGPINDRKMVINMLSRTAAGHRADAAMLDFEDAMKPSWSNVVAGLENLIGAAESTLTYVKPSRDGAPAKRYELDPNDMPLLMVRVRGLHLDESNVMVDRMPVSSGLFDLTMSVFHTARALLDRGKTPKYYVPKCEHYLEARWWNRLFCLLEEAIEVPRGTLKATFLIETLPAAFQMEEILYEIREHAAGLNGGRWDKIFSDIKILREHPDRILADRSTISMNRPWMKNYALRLIDVCHRHGAFAMGGMAAFTPGATRERRDEQTHKVVEDKEFEASIGHDGCWVSHPYFIGPAMGAFTRGNQLDVLPDVEDTPDLLPQGTGPRTMAGLRKNVRVGIAYMRGWNQGVGCVAWDDLMEDLATFEISRAQVWQWVRHGVSLDDGSTVDRGLVERIFTEERDRILRELRDTAARGDSPEVSEEEVRFREAAAGAGAIFTETRFRPFLTIRSEYAGAELEQRRAELNVGAGD